jgi:predicted transposase/invertase (TIGR01784 family)
MRLSIKDKYIDPLTDFGFKRIFGSEEHKHFLISFLNDLLTLEDDIVDLEYRNLEKLGLNRVDRRAIFDVYCTDSKDNHFIVELQRTPQRYFKDRSVYYTSFPIQEQSQKGFWDYRLKKVFFVGLLDFKIDDSPDYLTEVKLVNTRSKEVFFDNLVYYYIELPKFTKYENELSSHLDYWLYYLRHLAESQSIPKSLEHDTIMKEAFETAEFFALPPKKQFRYQHELKIRLDNYNAALYAKELAEEAQALAVKEGKAKGEAIGIKNGKIAGKQEGKIEGKREGKREEKIAIAISLLDVLDSETIALKIGLSLEEVQALK